MPAEYIDIFSAKERITRMLRECGAQPYSRLLMNSQLPEDVLRNVLKLLQDENKVRVISAPQTSAREVPAEITYQPVSGAWSLSGLSAW